MVTTGHSTAQEALQRARSRWTGERLPAPMVSQHSPCKQATAQRPPQATGKGFYLISEKPVSQLRNGVYPSPHSSPAGPVSARHKKNPFFRWFLSQFIKCRFQYNWLACSALHSLFWVVFWLVFVPLARSAGLHAGQFCRSSSRMRRSSSFFRRPSIP